MIYKHDYQRMALDTDRMMITQCGNDYHDYSNNKLACIYIKWAEEHCPERLQAETDKGRIYVHIDERITECEKEKWKIWNKMRDTDSEYALAMKNADTAKVWQLENLFELQAEEIAVKMCLLVQLHIWLLLFCKNQQNSFGLVLAKRVLFFYSLRFSLSFTFRYSFGDIPMYL